MPYVVIGALRSTRQSRAGFRAMCRIAVALVSPVGCSNDAGEDIAPVRPTRQIVDARSWTRVSGGPFAAPSGMRVECESPLGFEAQDFGGAVAFEVNTGYCNWGSFEQVLTDDVSEGELVRVRLWHFELLAPGPAEGYAAFAVDGEVRWEYRVAIPAPSALDAHGWIADEEIPTGTAVQFHVHNHGINTWTLVEVTAGPEEEPSADRSLSD